MVPIGRLLTCRLRSAAAQVVEDCSCRVFERLVEDDFCDFAVVCGEYGLGWPEG